LSRQAARALLPFGKNWHITEDKRVEKEEIREGLPEPGRRSPL